MSPSRNHLYVYLLGLAALTLSGQSPQARILAEPRNVSLTAEIKQNWELGRGLDDRHALRILREAADATGGTLTLAQQHFQGLRVLGGELILRRAASGRLETAADALVRNFSLDTNPTLQAAEALAITRIKVAPRGDYTAPPTTELVVYPIRRLIPRPGVKHPANAADFEEIVDRHELAYLVHVEIEQGEDTRHENLLVHANTGEVLQRWSSLHTAAQEGVGSSQYSGTVKLSTNTIPGGFELRDLLRVGNYTTDMGSTTAGNGFIYTSAVNAWGDGANHLPGSSGSSLNGQTAAVDAHYGMQVTWDFLNRILGRNGIDGSGRSVFSRVHYSTDYDNAFWSDACFCMTFGDGSVFKTLTSLDVAAHEMAHGVTSSTANLAYYGESGGLNEANSDIFGTMVEFYSRGANGQGYVIPDTGGNWTMGEQLVTSRFPNPLRYLYKPSLDGRSPDAWSPALAGLDVHYSSGPMNRAFFFLSQGASADAASPFRSAYLPAGMKGLGNDKAFRIWWRTLSTRLTSTSNYLAARTGAIAAASELYGPGGPEEAAVWNAFAAINVGSPWTDSTVPLVVAKEAGTSGTLTFTATASDNVGVTKVEYYVDGALKGSVTASPYTLACNSISLLNGAHSLVAKAYDAAGNVGTSAALAFLVNNVDATAPTVVAKLTSAGGNFTCAATASDNVGVTRVEYVVDGLLKGSATTSPYTLAFSSSTLANGVHSLIAKGYDAAGNVGISAAVSFILDTMPPVVSPKVAGTAGTLAFTATASDNLGVTKVEYYVDGVLKGSATASPYTLACNSISLLNGTHSLIAKAYDAVGNIGSSVAVPFTVNNKDTTAPSVVAKLTSAGGNFTCTATASDNVGVTRVEYVVDGLLKGSATTSPYTLAFSSSTLANGVHSLIAKGYDAAGNVGISAAVSFILDTMPPVVSPKVAGTAGTLAFTATASDNLGVTKVEYYVDGVLKGSATASPYTLACNSISLLNGTHSLIAKAYDAVGNIGSSVAVPFTVNNKDTTAPSVVAKLTSAGGNFTCTATASDNVGVTRVEYVVDGLLKGSATTSPYTLAFSSSTLANGVHSLIAKGYDAAGNVGISAAVSFILDTMPPVVSPKVAGTAGTLAFTATASDNLGVTKVEYYVDGVLKGSATASPYTLACNSISLLNGTHSLVAKAYDAVGNIGSSVAVPFTVNNKDTTAPSVVAKLTSAGGNFTCTATASDNVGVTRVEYVVDGLLKGSATTSPYTLAFSYSTLANGVHSLIAKGYDAAGNVGISAAVSFILDTMPPVVSPKVIGTAGTLAFTATASDNLGVTKVEYYVDGVLKGSATASPYTLAFNSTTVVDGDHTLVAKAFDAAGNVGASPSVLFKVANSVPSNTYSEVELNDSVTTANKIPDATSTIRGALSTGLDVDTFAISLVVSQSVQLTLASPAGMVYGMRLAPGITNPTPQGIAYIQVYSLTGQGSSSPYIIAIRR